MNFFRNLFKDKASNDVASFACADTPEIKAMGHIVDPFSSGFDNVLNNPDAITLDTYSRMYETDETVASAVDFTILATLSRLGEYSHKDPKIQEFVRNNFESMRGSFVPLCSEILSAVWAGFSVTEKIWRLDGGKIWLDTLQPLYPSTIEFELETEEGKKYPKNTVRAIHQYRNQVGAVEIPPEKAIHYVCNRRFGNPYGQSRLRPTYKNWFLKDKALKYLGIALERYGMPLTVGKVSNASTSVRVGTSLKSVIDYMNEILDNIQAKTSLTITNDMDIDVKQPFRYVGGDFKDCITHCNIMIYRSLLMPSLVTDQGDTGSYALGQKHFDLFVLMLDFLLNDLDEALIEQVVRQIISYNFSGVDDFGSFEKGKFQAEDQKMLSDVFLSMTNGGYLSPSRIDDLNAVRERLGFSKVEEAEINPLLIGTKPDKATAGSASSEVSGQGEPQ